MTDLNRKPGKPQISNLRFYSGVGVFIFGFLCPLFIPLVAGSDLDIGWKTGISAFMAFGLPELFMLISVAILGKDGYQFLKSKIGLFLKPFAPPDKVSSIRYRVGLILFVVPLILGWAFPYLVLYFSELKDISLTYFIVADAMFLISFFVLGGHFWDKFRSLFVQG